MGVRLAASVAASEGGVTTVTQSYRARCLTVEVSGDLKITNGAPLRKAGINSSGEMLASPRNTPSAVVFCERAIGLARSLAE